MSSSREFRFPAVFQISVQRLQQVPPMYTESHMHSLQDALNLQDALSNILLPCVPEILTMFREAS